MISHEVLGPPGGDNALLVTIDSGQSLHRWLFDCGAGCLEGVPAAHVQTLRGVFFSHYHVDHIAGFDHFVRLNFYREKDFPQLYGPAGTLDVLQHRLQGCTWNLVGDSAGEMHLHEIAVGSVTRCELRTCEGFSQRHNPLTRASDGLIFENADYTVHACPLPHGIVSMGYRISEKPRQNIHLQAATEQGLRPGAWLQALKDPAVTDQQTVDVNGVSYVVGKLREQLVQVTPGDSIAYLTDFRLDDAARQPLLQMIAGCGVVVCENQYLNEDEELAANNHHMVARDAGQLAADADAGKLVVFHVSSRYTRRQWQQQLAQVQAVFAAAEYPPHWQIA